MATLQEAHGGSTQLAKMTRDYRWCQMIEIFPELSGIGFDEAWGRRVEEMIDSTTGQKAFFISAKDFIANKLAAGRPQDLADVAAVQRASELALRTSERRDADASGHRFPAN